MFKINYKDEKELTNFLTYRSSIFYNRNKKIDSILGIEEENNIWDLDLTLYGQLFETNYDRDTSLKMISHCILNVKKINNEYFGNIKVLNTPCGKLLNELIISNCKLELECIYHIYDSKKIIRIDIK